VTGPYLIAYMPLQDSAQDGYLEAAVKAYVLSKGWPSLQSNNWSKDETGDGSTLKAALSMLQAGDILLLPDLASISDRPSIQESTLLGLLAQGIRVHVLSLNGPLEPHLFALREVWSSTRPLEVDRDALTRKYELREAQIERDRVEFENEFSDRMAKRVGWRTMSQPEEVAPETHVAKYIKTQREARGLTQAQLATLANTSKAQISRIELTGKGDAIPAVLKAISDYQIWTPETVMPTNDQPGAN